MKIPKEFVRNADTACRSSEKMAASLRTLFLDTTFLSADDFHFQAHGRPSHFLIAGLLEGDSAPAPFCLGATAGAMARDGSVQRFPSRDRSASGLRP